MRDRIKTKTKKKAIILYLPDFFIYTSTPTIPIKAAIKVILPNKIACCHKS